MTQFTAVKFKYRLSFYTWYDIINIHTKIFEAEKYDFKLSKDGEWRKQDEKTIIPYSARSVHGALPYADYGVCRGWYDRKQYGAFLLPKNRQTAAFEWFIFLVLSVQFPVRRDSNSHR